MSNTNAKKVLKSIVKECLMEILSEGLNGGAARPVVSEAAAPKINKAAKPAASARQVAAKQNSRIDEMVNAVATDDIMRSILADTAKTTLVEQMQHESRGAASALDPTVGAGIDLDSMFSEASSAWSEMAFSNRKPGTH